MKAAHHILLILTLIMSPIILTSCSTTQVRQTMKEYRLIIKPGKNLRPRTYETGEGDTQYLETEPGEGDTLMIIIRGRM
ncbi:MAG: hypothetical protein JXR76_12835 [Deltaproteobacteria bacterium]|nr:hypothetical protein [Deltaproteobacteria bacterium]